MKLSELKTGQSGIITSIDGEGAFRRRISEMGFVRGKRVIVVKNAPLHDPIEYNIMGYEVSLRRYEASMLEVSNVETVSDFNTPHHSSTGIANDPIESSNTIVSLQQDQECDNCSNSEDRKCRKHDTQDANGNKICRKGKRCASGSMAHPLVPNQITPHKTHRMINVVLVGNPNSGKTTIFNYLCGMDQHTGNYSGVTVDATSAYVEFSGYIIRITDLPGTYSISPFSPEERFVQDHLSEHKPDVVINVVDGSNIERNLYLSTQLIDMDQNSVLAMNMYDEFLASGDHMNRRKMGELLGMPIVPTVGKRGRGVAHILQHVVELYEANNPNEDRPKITYPIEIEQLILQISEFINNNHKFKNNLTIPQRYFAIKTVEGQSNSIDTLHGQDPEAEADLENMISDINKKVREIELIYKSDIGTIMTDARYAFISGAMKEAYTYADRSYHTHSTKIDNILTHKYLGLPIFVFVLWLVFYSTFTLGEYPMNWISYGVVFIKHLVADMMGSGPLKSLLVNGIIDGIGSVVIFLPNIVILFLFISFMEDTGYMARVAFITDKLMHKIGLHGKSFIPMIMGFGCGVPAIMATRTIENRHNRIQTMLLIPFMSCSARLPVYILIAGTFFADNAGNVLFMMYFGGLILAVISALLFKKFLFKGKNVDFVMELPPYRIPTLRSTVKHVWHKAKDYLSKMGGVILVAVVIIWALGYYPRPYYGDEYTATNSTSTIVDSAVVSTPNDEIAQPKNSYLVRIGKAIEPAIAPLGFDWKMGIGLLSGIAAKEVIVSSMGVIYQTPEDEESALGDRLIQERRDDGTLVWSQATAASFLAFVLIYFPCVAAIAAIRKESGAWKWAIFTVIYTTTLAWVVSFIVYRLFNLFI